MTWMLGSLTLETPVVLSPMEGVSDVGFRALCHAQGAALTYTEMIRAKGVARHNKSTLDLIDTFDASVPTGLQLMTTGPDELSEALKAIDELAATSHPHFMNIIAVDLNFGCPSPEVIRIGAGPAMLKRRGRLENIFERLSTWKKQTKLPVQAVTAKIRLGLNAREQEHKVFLPVVEAASKFLDGIVVHARHAGQKSRDLPTWSAIAEAKKISGIPVIGNGDVNTLADLQRMQTQTGCDAVMVARAAIKNPWSLRALTGRGTDAATLADVNAAKDAYMHTAAALAGKPKYLQFHEENFGRLLARARGENVVAVIPRTLHLT
jgi:tRNA-dihydrouridine synthase B